MIRSIEIIGEAANKVRTADPDFAARHPQIPWNVMYGMRNRIVHDYFEVDLQVVWQTVQQDLPGLRELIVPLLKGTPPSDRVSSIDRLPIEPTGNDSPHPRNDE